MPPTTYQEVVRDFVGTPFGRWLRGLFSNSSSNAQASTSSSQNGQPNLIISKSKGAYKGVLPHSLIAFGEGEQRRWYIVINPPRSLHGATGRIKYLYEIDPSGSTKLSDPIEPKDCSYVIKRAFYYKRTGVHGPSSQFYLGSKRGMWQHEAALTGLVTGQGTGNLSQFFHERQSNNPAKPFKPELKLRRIYGPDFWSICCGEGFIFPRPTLAQIVAWSMSAAQELQRIHERGVIHGDVALPNLMLDIRTNQVQFVDFGYGDYIKPNLRFFREDKRGRYSSLEDYLLEGRASNTISSDIYSFGMVLGQIYGSPRCDNNIAFLQGDCVGKIIENFYNCRAAYKENFMGYFKKYFDIKEVSVEEQLVLQKITDIIFRLTATFDSSRMDLIRARSKFEEVQKLLSDRPRLAQMKAKVANFRQNAYICPVTWSDMKKIGCGQFKEEWDRVVVAILEKQRQAKLAAEAAERQKLAVEEAEKRRLAAEVEQQRLAAEKRSQVRLAAQVAVAEANRAPVMYSRFGAMF